MDKDFLQEILEELKEIYLNAILEARDNSNYVLVGELKKGDFYAKYNSLDDLLKILKNVQNEIDELDKKEFTTKYGCQIAGGLSSIGGC